MESGTTLSEEQVVEAALRLNNAEKSQEQIPTLTSIHPNITFSDAYAIQDKWVQLKVGIGRAIVGHKVGLTSKVMQEAFGIDEPDFGVLLDDMIFNSGEVIPIGKYIEPRIEVELAFVFKDELDLENISHEMIKASTKYVIPAMELIDFRTVGNDPGHKRTVKDTIADNAANAAVVRGDKAIPQEIGLDTVSAVLYKNGEKATDGVASAILGHPLNSMAWLLNKYKSIGRKIKEGQLVLAGSFTAPIPVQKRDEIVADFGQYGKVSCKFE
ncbi:MAG: 2-oxo-hepta-3-ene-1,7-dioic acid hydratase [Flavobacteriales bacterium]|nr:2-oxo-hepta-3-ene-1,7-dioic acid hydratase [Flavobacteriales bacterium]